MDILTQLFDSVRQQAAQGIKTSVEATKPSDAHNRPWRAMQIHESPDEEDDDVVFVGEEQGSVPTGGLLELKELFRNQGIESGLPEGLDDEILEAIGTFLVKFSVFSCT